MTIYNNMFPNHVNGKVKDDYIFKATVAQHFRPGFSMQ